MKRLTIALFAVAAITIATAGWLAIEFNRFLHTPAAIPDAGYDLEIRSGSSLASVAERLSDDGVISSARYLRWYGRYTGQAGDIQAGDYQLVVGETPAEILQRFVAGDVRLATFTIIEGWNFRDLLAALERAEDIDGSLSEEALFQLLDELGSEFTHPEGLFLPETYHFPRNTSAEDVLRLAYQHLQQILQAEWSTRDDGLPLDTPYDALILASIIEKETARADERAQISGVFVRRLNKGMRLQTDPTVIYGIGPAFDGNITRKHLRTDTPYNTYTRHGLPPTPIAMPGADAIRAALNPAIGDTLYFVATGLGDGSHKFSATKAEHDAAVREYLARRRAQRLKDGS